MSSGSLSDGIKGGHTQANLPRYGNAQEEPWCSRRPNDAFSQHEPVAIAGFAKLAPFEVATPLTHAKYKTPHFLYFDVRAKIHAFP